MTLNEIIYKLQKAKEMYGPDSPIHRSSEIELKNFFYSKKMQLSPDSIGKEIARRISRKIESSLITTQDGLDIAYEIEAYLIPRIRSPKKDYKQQGLLQRIAKLESQLDEFRSNPALEKKVAKLEKELRKVKVASTVTMEGNKKEREDMLKNYKEAEKKVFVIMPFALIFDDVWNGGIERACKSEDFGYLRVDKISLSSWITEDIVNYIELADFVIADITGNNPNVMFELGWALARDRKPIVIRQKGDPNEVPFDVKGIRYISYVNSWSGIERLYRDICKFLKTTLETAEEKPTTEKSNKKKKTKKAN